MTDKIKEAFDIIKAEDSLKQSTKYFFQNNTAKEKRRKPFMGMIGMFALTASFIIIFMISYRLYLTPKFYLELDVNPSIELVVNSFEKVIDVFPYNGDGATAIENTDLYHKNYSDAIKILMTSFDNSGYIKSDGLISVTFQTENPVNEESLSTAIKESVMVAVGEKHKDFSLEIFPVSQEIRKSARQCMMPPAKLIAITALMEIDPSVTMDDCRRHSIKMIKEMTENYKINNIDDLKALPETDKEESVLTESTTPTNHQRRHGRHHGNLVLK